MTSLMMLWEPHDPAVVLRERFNHDGVTAATAWLETVLHQDYGKQMAGCDKIVMSDNNALAWLQTVDGDRLILKWSVNQERFARLEALATVTDWLRRDGLPVSAPVRALDGRLQVERDGVSIGLQQVLPGHLLDVNEQAEVFAAGAMLAELHTALARGPQPPALTAHEPTAPPGEQILEWLGSQPPQADPGTARVLRDMVLAADPQLPDRQIVHGDYRSANVLTECGRVTGVLDFEEARWDHQVVELARQAVLLGTQYHDWGPVAASTREQLRAGYESIRPLTSAEASWWRPLVLWFTLLLTPTGDDATGWGRSAREQVTTPT